MNSPARYGMSSCGRATASPSSSRTSTLATAVAPGAYRTSAAGRTVATIDPCASSSSSSSVATVTAVVPLPASNTASAGAA